MSETVCHVQMSMMNVRMALDTFNKTKCVSNRRDLLNKYFTLVKSRGLIRLGPSGWESGHLCNAVVDVGGWTDEELEEMLGMG